MKKKNQTQVSLEVSVYLRYLYQEKDITLLFQKQLFIDIPRNM